MYGHMVKTRKKQFSELKKGSTKKEAGNKDKEKHT